MSGAPPPRQSTSTSASPPYPLRSRDPAAPAPAVSPPARTRKRRAAADRPADADRAPAPRRRKPAAANKRNVDDVAGPPPNPKRRPPPAPRNARHPLQDAPEPPAKRPTPAPQRSPGHIMADDEMTPPTSAALQSLLRKFGGFDGPSSSLGTPVLRNLYTGLSAEGDEDRQFQCVSELCNLLSIATEDSMSAFNLDQFVPLLVRLLNMEHNPNMMLMAARCLTHLMEALPSSTAAIVHYEGVPSFCSKLMSIEYIDLAEQSLQAIEKISAEHPAAVLRAGGLMASLAYIDFFAMGVQRVAVSIAANVCRQVPGDMFDNYIADSVPILTNMLQYADQKIVESATLAFSRLVDSYSANDARLQAICAPGLLPHLVRLFSNSAGFAISPSAYTTVVHTLSTVCQGSPALTHNLLSEGIALTLQRVLAPSAQVSSVNLPAEQLFALLSLANALLPPLPKTHSSPMFSPQKALARFIPRLRARSDESPHDSPANIEARRKMFAEHPELLNNIGESLLSVLLQVFVTTVNPPVRLKCLSAIARIAHYGPPEMLTLLLKDIGVSSFLASLIASRDWTFVVVALQISEMLIEKLAEIFGVYFRREGVVFELERLANVNIELPRSPDKKESAAAASSSAAATSGTPLSPDAAARQPSTAARTAELRTWAISKAQHILDVHFNSSERDAAAAEAADQVLARLSGLCARLKAVVKAAEPSDATIIDEIRTVLASSEGVSPFEILQSGIVECLLDYLTRLDPRGTPNRYGRRQHRLSSFSALSQGEVGDAVGPFAGSHSSNAFAILVRKLQGVANQLEQFPVVVNDFVGFSQGLKVLTQPFKLRLVKAPDCPETVSDYSYNVVLIEPLATIAAIDDFLSRKVLPRGGRGPSSSSAAAGSANRPRFVNDNDDDDDDDDDDDNNNNSNTGGGSAGDGLQLLGGELEDEEIDEDEAMFGDGGNPAERVVNVKLDPSSPVSGQNQEQLRRQERRKRAKEMRRAMEQQQRERARQQQQERLLEPSSKLQFTLEDKVLPSTTTIFQAVQQHARDQGALNPEEPPSGQRLWSEVYTLVYRPKPEATATAAAAAGPAAAGPSTPPRASGARAGRADGPDFGPASGASPFDRFMSTPERPVDSRIGTVLSLLKILDVYNRKWRSLGRAPGSGGEGTPSFIAQAEFVNQKLTAKLMRQLQDPLTLCSGGLPEWCTQLSREYLFVFPFETRRLFFNLTSFGIARALHRLQTQQQATGNDPSDFRVGRIPRQQVRISRERMLDSCTKVMELYASSKSVLEVEYFGEAGTGLGPTLEFFTLVSREFCRTDLALWLNPPASSGDKYVETKLGLFPRPYASSDPKLSKVLRRFTTMGRFVARALLDGRLLDLPLSEAFYMLLLGEEPSAYDVKLVDADLGRTVEAIADLVARKQALALRLDLDGEQRAKEEKEQLLLFGQPVEALGLDFTLPGYPEYSLGAGGAETDVTLDNIDEYLAALLSALFHDGVRDQLEAFKAGFGEVFPLEKLDVFRADELDQTLNGCVEQWTKQTLLDHTKCDHGYTHDSKAVQYLFEILSEMTPEEQRAFILFATGAPKLPVGGLAALNPKLTIVRKAAEGADRDTALPSVNTCFVYLKLPDYGSKEVMRTKLLLAMREGVGNFLLS